MAGFGNLGAPRHGSTSYSSQGSDTRTRNAGQPTDSGVMTDYSKYSFWLETCGEELIPRPDLQKSTDVDVAILGGGYTGLWTAYYLLRTNPRLRVAVLEKEIAGYGASGRNGGWCSSKF